MNRFSTRYRRLVSVTILLTVFGILTTCDTTFEPMQENNQYHFSVYGYLDVSADTQWVRVTLVRDQLRPTGEPLDATVTLENLSNGETMVMNDSLIQVLGETVPVAWTTEKIEPDTPYEMRLQGGGQQVSRAEILTPEKIPTPLADISPNKYSRPHSVFIQVPGVLVDVQAIYCLRERGTPEEEFRIVTISFGEHRFLTSEGYPTRYRVDFAGATAYMMERVILAPLEEFDEKFQFFPRQARVFTSNDTWPDFASVDRLEQEIPNGSTSNIENGVGFLGSLLSNTIPFKACTDEEGEEIPCETEPLITSPLQCLDDGNFEPADDLR